MERESGLFFSNKYLRKLLLEGELEVWFNVCAFHQRGKRKNCFLDNLHLFFIFCRHALRLLFYICRNVLLSPSTDLETVHVLIYLENGGVFSPVAELFNPRIT